MWLFLSASLRRRRRRRRCDALTLCAVSNVIKLGVAALFGILLSSLVCDVAVFQADGRLMAANGRTVSGA